MKSLEQSQQAERDQQERTGIPTRQEAVVASQRPTRPAISKGIVAYVLIAFGLAWALWIPAWLLHIPATSQLFQLAFLAGAFAPALAAITVRRWITHEGFADAGLRLHLRSKWPYYLFAWLWPWLLGFGLVALVGGLGVGKPDFSMQLGSLSVPTFVSGYLAPLIVVLAYTPILWGEEFGWRSYLQMRLFSNRPLLAAVTTGVIWGVWHYPAVLAGYLPNEHGLLSLLLFPWYTVLFSIILGWLRLRTGSVWSVSLAHSANNFILPQLGLILSISGAYGDWLSPYAGSWW